MIDGLMRIVELLSIFEPDFLPQNSVYVYEYLYSFDHTLCETNNFSKQYI